MNKITLIVLLIFSSLTSCKIADLRSTEIKKGTYKAENNILAKKILSESIKKQGLDKINNYSTYEVTAKDHHKGLLGKIGNPWGVNNQKILFQFIVGTFDNKMTILQGKKKGFIAGLQAWDYYEQENGVLNTNVKDDKAKIFNLAALNYFFELGDRMIKAPFISYLGEDKVDGKEVHKIFVSWGTDRTKDYDQYILRIGKESKLIEAASFTVRESPLMGSSILTGTMRFENYTKIGDILIPHLLRATVGKKPKNNKPKKYLHQFVVENFKWDSFDKKELRPFEKNENLSGNKKMTKKSK